MNIDEHKKYEKMLAWRKLKQELSEGRRSDDENRWVSSEDVRKHFEERYSR